jgi:hypothetical protein
MLLLDSSLGFSSGATLVCALEVSDEHGTFHQYYLCQWLDVFVFPDGEH